MMRNPFHRLAQHYAIFRISRDFYHPSKGEQVLAESRAALAVILNYGAEKYIEREGRSPEEKRAERLSKGVLDNETRDVYRIGSSVVPQLGSLFDIATHEKKPNPFKRASNVNHQTKDPLDIRGLPPLFSGNMVSSEGRKDALDQLVSALKEHQDEFRKGRTVGRLGGELGRTLKQGIELLPPKEQKAAFGVMKAIRQQHKESNEQVK